MIEGYIKIAAGLGSTTPYYLLTTSFSGHPLDPKPWHSRELFGVEGLGRRD